VDELARMTTLAAIRRLRRLQAAELAHADPRNYT
jgi:hypothetical protein